MLLPGICVGGFEWESCDKPGVHRELRVEHAGRDAELLQEEFEAVAAVNGPDEDEGLAPDQGQLEQGVDEQELILLLTADVVLCELGAAWQLGALQLQSHLEGDGEE